MLEEAVEFAAVQGAPRAVKVVSRLRLLPGVVVVQELHEGPITESIAGGGGVMLVVSKQEPRRRRSTHLVKYAELLPRLALDLLLLCLNIRAG